ncbi:MAG: rod shape-determining protein MreC [Microthrixaceae bacterium]|nr:rod shape-determining protein MreC [Microthrixaceae bacterium]
MRPKPAAGTRGRSRRLLVIVTLLAVTLITVDAVGGDALDPVRNTATDVFAPVGDGVAWASTPLRNAWAGITGYDELERENARLRDELAEQRSHRLANANAVEQLGRLRKEIDVGVQGDIPTEIARIATGARSNFTDHRLEIDKGSSSGLEVGNPVTAGNGLVGRLVRVAANRSTVQLITDPTFVIGVRIGETQEIGVGHGSGPQSPFVVDTGISLESEVEVDGAVLTSGFDRAVMPPDLVVGRVKEVQPDEAAQSLILRVDLAAPISQLDVVKVLKWVPSS